MLGVNYMYRYMDENLLYKCGVRSIVFVISLFVQFQCSIVVLSSLTVRV